MPKTDNKPTVEECITELRGMFPDRCISLTWSIGIAAGQQVSVHLINPESNGTNWGDKRFSAPTLDEAMARVRAWKESQ